MKVWGYIRVSTQTQADTGYGLEMQRDAIVEYCRQYGHELLDIFEDQGVSGAKHNIAVYGDELVSESRAGLMDLLAHITPEARHIVVYHTSRLWREEFTTAIIRRKLKQLDAEILSITEPTYSVHSKNPTDKLLSNILDSLAAFDRDQTVARLANGRETKAKGGDKAAGVCTYGYRYTDDRKHVEIDEEEARVVWRIFSLAHQGKSLNRIAQTLNRDGIRTRRGNLFSAQGIAVILKNRFYLGYVNYRGQEIEGNHPPLVSKIQFGKVAAQLRRRDPHQRFPKA